MRAVVNPTGSLILVALLRLAESGMALTTFIWNPENRQSSEGGTVLTRKRSDDGFVGLGNPSPFFLTDREALLAFRDHVNESGKRVYRLRVVFSEDGGRSWNYVLGESVGLIDASDYGLWEPFLYRDAAGALRVVYAKERETSGCAGREGRKQDIVMKYSMDGGKTWIGETIVASAESSRDGVPTVARLRDGSFIMLFESWAVPTCGGLDTRLMIRSMRSKDGVSWDTRRDVFAPLGEGGGGGRRVATWPYVAALSDGRVALAFTRGRVGRPRDRADVLKWRTQKDYRLSLMLSEGGAGYEDLRWDFDSLLDVAPYDGDRIDKNRFPSLLVAGDLVLVFSGSPVRYAELYRDPSK